MNVRYYAKHFFTRCLKLPLSRDDDQVGDQVVGTPTWKATYSPWQVEVNLMQGGLVTAAYRRGKSVTAGRHTTGRGPIPVSCDNHRSAR